MTTGRPETLVLSPEHEELRSAVRAFLESVSPESAVRTVMETTEGFDSKTWTRGAAELGLAGLLVPEQFGGSGFGFVEMSVVLEEAGRALLPAPLLSSAVLAVCALVTSADQAAQRDYLPVLASGELRATVVLPRVGDCIVAAGGVLNGTAEFVLDGYTSNLLLVAAAEAGGLSLYAVEASASGVTRDALSTMDLTRKLARVTFEGAPARLIGTAGAASAQLAQLADIAAVALACEQVGGAQKTLDITVEYAAPETSSDARSDRSKP